MEISLLKDTKVIKINNLNVFEALNTKKISKSQR